MAILNEWIRIIFLVVTYGVGWDTSQQLQETTGLPVPSTSFRPLNELAKHRNFHGGTLNFWGYADVSVPPRGGVYSQFQSCISMRRLLYVRFSSDFGSGSLFE